MGLLKYFNLLKEEGLARRYFVMNSFDGTLTLLGVIIAMFLAGVRTPQLLIVSCLGAAISLMVSGIWSAYAAEKAERKKRLKELERHLLKELSETKLEKRVSQLSILLALVNGLSPLLISLIIISPFIFCQLNLISILTAFLASFSLILIVLFFLGVVVGKIAEENLIRSGLTMLSAGILVSIIIFTLQFLKVI